MFRTTIAALAVAAVTINASPIIQKRTSGHATYYAVGLGACGQYNVPSDFIVALNEAQYVGGSPGPNCFRGLTIHANGKSAHATVMDLCPAPGCGYGDLDLSQSLFEFFNPTSVGLFNIEWEFDGEGGGPPPAPPPAPAPVPPPEPTSPVVIIPSSTSSSSSVESSSSAVPDASFGVQNVAPNPNIPGSYPGLGNIGALAKAVVNMGNMIGTGAGVGAAPPPAAANPPSPSSSASASATVTPPPA